ncbi:hypothetical protein BAC3_00751 [uncultured bacterium]|nr:hypothetical protein BAC3_00751 [uncultured bacterium]
MGIAEVSFFAGILLFFVAIIGGGIEVKELKIPQINGSAKYSCLAGSLMFIALGLYLKNVLPVISASTNPTTAKVETKAPEIQTTVKTPTANQQVPAPSEQTAGTTPATVPTQQVPTTPQNTPAQTTNTETTNTTASGLEKSKLAKHYAQTQLDDANKRLNEVWNAADQDIRNELLPKQKQWLNQRDADCATKAANETDSDDVMKEALKIGCMAKLTDPRIKQLQQEIAEIEQSIVEEPETPNQTSMASINSTSIHDVQINPKQQAKQQLNDANKRLNAVWNATTADIRKELLPEQREWLKKREDDCTAQAVNEDKDMQDVLKLSCMANMTDPRTEELKQRIAELTQ